MPGTKQIRSGKVVRFKKDLEIRLEVWKEGLEEKSPEFRPYFEGYIKALEYVVEEIEREFCLE